MKRNVGVVLHAVQTRHRDMFLGAFLSFTGSIDNIRQALKKDWSAATQLIEHQNLVF
jgi:hypothetical protein